jgi:hypothetical protein
MRGMTFIPNFVKIRHLVKSVPPPTHTKDGDILHLPFLLKMITLAWF